MSLAVQRPVGWAPTEIAPEAFLVRMSLQRDG